MGQSLRPSVRRELLLPRVHFGASSFQTDPVGVAAPPSETIEASGVSLTQGDLQSVDVTEVFSVSVEGQI